MKRKIVILTVLVMLFSGIAYSQQMSMGTSEQQTGDALITTSDGFFNGVLVACASGVTVDIYDNTSAAGRKMMPTVYLPGSSTNQLFSINVDPPVAYHNGIYVDVTTTGTLRYMVYFLPR